MIIHIVKTGDTIEAISAQYGVSRERIILENELPNPDKLIIGQSIGIRVPEVTYTVVAGDTLESVAKKYDVTPIRILQHNPQVATREELFPGEVLVITYANETPIDTVIINGYAYPFIDRTVLKKTLPFLTYISLFTYGFTSTGELIPIEDEEIIALSKDLGVAPIMVLAPMDTSGNFSSDAAHDIFYNQEAVTALTNNLITTMQAKGYRGIDIDFEFVLPDDKDAFLNFIKTISTGLDKAGLIMFVALAPKISGDMKGLLYEAHDYPTIGAVADKVLLMTYEWGYTYGEPMATSPINNMRNVLRYGVSVIDPDIILMGTPNYAYDWPLPFVQGKTAAQSLGNQEAIERAVKFGVEIQFDEIAQSPFYNYTNEDGVNHVVWFDDVRSMNAKLRLIPEFGLSGSGVWQLMRYFPGLWMVFDTIFTLVKV
jgi:spore germination protein